MIYIPGRTPIFIPTATSHHSSGASYCQGNCSGTEAAGYAFVFVVVFLLGFTALMGVIEASMYGSEQVKPFNTYMKRIFFTWGLGFLLGRILWKKRS